MKSCDLPFRSTCIGLAISVLVAVHGPAKLNSAETNVERLSRDLLSRHRIEPTAEGTLAYLQRLKPDRKARARVAELIEQLGSEVFVVREHASSELTELGAIAIPLLKAASHSHDLERAIRARQLLAAVQSQQNIDLRESLFAAAFHVLQREKSPQTPTVLLDIFPLLENHRLWYAASEALWANVQSAHEDTIRAKLKEPHLATRLAAIVALELAIGENSVMELRGFLDDDLDAVRLAACRALLNQLPRQCLHTLVGLLDSEDFEVRLQAMWLLRDLTGQKFGDDPNEDLATVTEHWKRWADANDESAKLQTPVGNQRLQLHRAMVIFRENFARAVPSIAKSYGRFRYESTIPAKASVVDGVLRLDGDHAEADQRLFIEAKELVGRPELPRPFFVQAELTGEAAGSGAYHVGVSVGRIKVLFHPNYSGGAFRVETTDEHRYLITNQNMGFTPAAGVMHKMTLRVAKGINGQVKFEAAVTDGSNPRHKYVNRFELESDEVGRLDRIGLERSGRTGGAGLFGSVLVDLSGKR